MAHNNIYEVSCFPIHPGERIDAACIEINNKWFVSSRTEGVRDANAEERENAILALAEYEKAGRGISVQDSVLENCKYLLVTSKEDFFRPMWERFRKEMKSTVSLEEYMAYTKDDDTYDVPYITMDNEIWYLAAFVRECAVNSPYYLGGVVDYRC